MARWLPSAWGVAPTPMKAPGLISASVALTTPYTAALSVSFTFTSPASPALTVSVEPSTAWIGPRRRTVCCCWANADEAASAASKAAPASMALVIPLIGPPKQRAAPGDGSHRLTSAAQGRHGRYRYSAPLATHPAASLHRG